MSEQGWGVWGKDDEAGAVNFIDAEKRRRAAGLVREGRVLSLAQPLSPSTPVPRHRAPMLHLMGRDGGDYAAGAQRPGGFQFAEDTIVMSLHIGTHMDALCHAWYEDRLYNGFQCTEVRSTSRAARCGIEKLPPVFTRGVLFDLVKMNNAPLPNGHSIGLAELQAAANNVGLERGDAVLIRTGWLEHHAKPGVSFDEEPGIDIEAADWLAKSEVALVGCDNFGIEVLPFPAGKVFPVHQRLIRDYGISLLEGLALKELGETGQSTFLFVAAPLPIVGGTGSPVTPLAVL
jgi:kynurenine formamidase